MGGGQPTDAISERLLQLELAVVHLFGPGPHLRPPPRSRDLRCSCIDYWQLLDEKMLGGGLALYRPAPIEDDYPIAAWHTWAKDCMPLAAMATSEQPCHGLPDRPDCRITAQNWDWSLAVHTDGRQIPLTPPDKKYLQWRWLCYSVTWPATSSYQPQKPKRVIRLALRAGEGRFILNGDVVADLILHKIGMLKHHELWHLYGLCPQLLEKYLEIGCLREVALLELYMEKRRLVSGREFEAQRRLVKDAGCLMIQRMLRNFNGMEDCWNLHVRVLFHVLAVELYTGHCGFEVAEKW
jgi:hypothetical protein